MSAPSAALDPTDARLLELLQADSKMAYAKLGEQVGLSAPAVLERVRKLEASGVIRGYRAIVDADLVGLDVTSFVGVTIAGTQASIDFVEFIRELAEVQEAHHVTGVYTLLLKVRTRSTRALESFLDRLRHRPGVHQTETMVALSTPTERTCVVVRPTEPPRARRGRKK